MSLIINWKKYIIVNLLVLGALYFVLLPGWLLITLTLLLFCFWSVIIGQLCHRRLNLSLANVLGLLYLLTFIAVSGFIGIYLQTFTNLFCWLIAIAIAVVSTIVIIKRPIVFVLSFSKLPIPTDLVLALFYLTFVLIAGQQLYINQTSSALNTPWQQLSPLFFIAYFLASAVLFFALRFYKQKNNFWPLIGLSIHLFLSLSVCLFIYRLGADYDPFIHKANVDLIIRDGRLLPTPLYYLGQYGLIIFLTTLSKINTQVIAVWLLPLLSAIFLPTLFANLGKIFNLKNTALIALSCLSLLILPLKTFTITTPQALADLFALSAIILMAMAITKKISLVPAWLAVVAALVTHLIAGLPIAAILAYFSIDKMSWFKRCPNKIITILKIESLAAAILVLPLAFLINAQKTASELKVGVISQPVIKLLNGLNNLKEFTYYRFINLQDFVYNFNNWRWLIVLLIVLAGWFVFQRLEQKKLAKQLIINFFTLTVASIVLWISIDFFSLVSGEQNTYSARLFELATYCLLPLIFVGLYGLWHKLFEQQRSLEIAAVVLLIGFITANLYLSYPRVDRWAENHGYSTSQTDIDTVNFIDKINVQKNYVVLASQPVSAAAISQLGYAHYYNGYFFYPVPTGGRLYKLFEELVYGKKKPSEIINTVRYLTDVKTVYFVLNRYWSGAEEAIVFYKNTADAWYAIADNNFIFVYNRDDVIDSMADKRLSELKK
jgi:hypothetical protein